ncbi:MAG TPA: alkaline phosphatase family protein [Acidimicrobiia bacterium]|nr:alkaline phosphatase family protein [Acidimicrobiia bacterium]
MSVVGVGVTAAPASSAAARAAKSPVKHVFIVVLENASASEVASPTFATTMPFLSSLAKKGVSLDQMYAIGHASLDNYIGMTSGYEPNAKTKADCFQYDCVYPAGQDDNIANQLEAKHLTWKGYLDGMTQPCQKPLVPGTPDPYQVGYATRHNPFMYYPSIVNNDSRCRSHVVPFPQLTTDLAANKVPNYSFISPSTCNDAHDRGSACGLEQADVWMSQHVQPILKSKAYKDGGVLIITTDESEITDTAGCCGNAQGGHIATFIVSPLIAAAGTHTATPYTHYSTLRWVEDSFGLPCLRNACDPGTHSFGTDVFKPVAAGRTTGTS